MSRRRVHDGDPGLHQLAENAGILTRWQDAAGKIQAVTEPALHHLLTALGLDCGSPGQINDSLRQLERDQDLQHGDLVVVRCGEVPRLRCNRHGPWQLELESGRSMTGLLKPDKPGWVRLDPVSEAGYHTLVLDHRVVTLAVVPRRCPRLPDTPTGKPRPWGLVAQIYSLKDSDSALPAWLHGAGFGAAGKLATIAAGQGADALALSPSHAMFTADPGRYSPYSPSSRLFMNVCYADPVQVLGQDAVQHVLGHWQPADVLSVTAQGQLLDWPRIAGLRVRLLRDLFAHFNHHGAPDLKNRFDVFRQQAGTALYRHALYEAIHTHYAPKLGPGHGWQDWPSALQDPGGSVTAQFARQHETEVLFHAFAQWLTFESAQQAQAGARSAGMACGLIADLAIGTDPRGSHAWSLQSDILTGVAVGAPPDVYQTQGQNWGLTAFSPWGLRRGAYSAFIDTLRASMGSAGGIRIDHIAGMERLWLIPKGAQAAEGAYLSYPRHELLGLIALEASRHNAIVIGENLGTVSQELTQAISDYGMLGTSVLWFERESTSAPSTAASPKSPTTSHPFRPARNWSQAALAMPSTHDLPTIHGWWQERDIQWKVLMQQLTRSDQDKAQDERARDRSALWDALRHQGCIPKVKTRMPEHAVTPLNAILSFVGRAPAPLVLYSLEDLLCVIDQPNMPGGDVDQRLVRHPNWLQQLPVPVDQIFADADVADRVKVIHRARGDVP